MKKSLISVRFEFGTLGATEFRCEQNSFQFAFSKQSLGTSLSEFLGLVLHISFISWVCGKLNLSYAGESVGRIGTVPALKRHAVNL